MFFQIDLRLLVIISLLFISCLREEDLDFGKFDKGKIELVNINSAFPLGYDTIKINKLFPSIDLSNISNDRNMIGLKDFLQKIEIVDQEIDKAEIVSLSYRLKIDIYFPADLTFVLVAEDENHNDIFDLGTLYIERSISDDTDHDIRQISSVDFKTLEIEKKDYDRIKEIKILISSVDFETRKLKSDMFIKYGISCQSKINIKI